jgi:hypothetical protein
MLPAWATVAIALGGSAITAVFALLGTWFTGHRQAEAEWRRLLVSAAEEFSTALGQALRSLAFALRPFLDDETSADARERIAEVRRVNAVATDRFPRIQLLFGQDSGAAANGRGALEQLHLADRYLGEAFDLAGEDEERESALVHEAEEAIVASERHHQGFNRAARSAIPGRPRRWLGLRVG